MPSRKRSGVVPEERREARNARRPADAGMAEAVVRRDLGQAIEKIRYHQGDSLRAGTVGGVATGGNPAIHAYTKTNMDKPKTELIGTWQSDRDDASGNQEYGRVTLKFGADGTLLYTVHERDKDQIMPLTYTVNEEFVVTSQNLGSKKLETNLHPTESCCWPSRPNIAIRTRNLTLQKRGWPDPRNALGSFHPVASTRPEANTYDCLCLPAFPRRSGTVHVDARR